VENSGFLNRLEKEVTELANRIWTEYSKYHNMCIGADKTPIRKKHNPRFSLMVLIFQTEERKCLMVFDWFLSKHGRYMSVFIHDGGLVDQLDKETVFPEELCIEGARIVNAITGYNMIIVVKPIEYNWSALKPQESQYEVMKRQFEQNNSIVGSLLCNIHLDGKMEMMKICDARIKFANWIVEQYDIETEKTRRKKFIDIWLEDPKRLGYERVGFYPNRSKCPANVYNLFRGFKAEKLKYQLEWDETVRLVQPIIEHFDYITGGYSERMCQTLASILQYPDIKTGVAVLIRDMGGLFIEGGGVGKNLIFEWFGNEILGEQYFIVVGDNRELYNPFNSLFEGKLLSLIEEASSRDNHTNYDMMKSRITSKKANINKKCIAQYEVDDYNRFIFCSNNRNAFPVRQGTRRIEVYDSNPVMRGNVTYFTNLIKHLNDDTVKYAFYTYLMSIKTFASPVDCQSTIPITNAFRDLRLMNAPLYHKWLVHCVQNNTLENNFTSELYKKFTKWVDETRDYIGDRMITATTFGNLLIGAKEVQQDGETVDYEIENVGFKYKKHGVMFMSWNIPELIKQLKSINLLEDDFKESA